MPAQKRYRHNKYRAADRPGAKKPFSLGLPLPGDMGLGRMPSDVVSESFRSVTQWIQETSRRRRQFVMSAEAAKLFLNASEAIVRQKWDEAIKLLREVIKKTRRRHWPKLQPLLAVALNARAVEKANKVIQECSEPLYSLNRRKSRSSFEYDDYVRLRKAFAARSGYYYEPPSYYSAPECKICGNPAEYELRQSNGEVQHICGLCRVDVNQEISERKTRLRTSLTAAQTDLTEALSLDSQNEVIRKNLESVEKILSSLPGKESSSSKRRKRPISNSWPFVDPQILFIALCLGLFKLWTLGGGWWIFAIVLMVSGIVGGIGWWIYMHIQYERINQMGFNRFKSPYW